MKTRSTVKERVKAGRKAKKKGFTLVELVIVIAILAILAAIAIPVITTTINATKMSVMESDAATLNMLVKEAVNVSLVHLRGVTYNGQLPSVATVSDICKENDIGQQGAFLVDDGTFFVRDIGGKTYTMVFTEGNGVEISGGTKPAVPNIVQLVDATTSVKDLAQ